MSKTILSTKVLKPHQKELILNAGLGYVAYDGIQINFIPIVLDFNTDYFIITSKNSAKALVQHINAHPQKEAGYKIPVFCVGDKTAKFLKDAGFYVAAQTDYGDELATLLLENYATAHFTFLAGNLRRDTIPELFTKHHISYKEVTCYTTTLVPKEFERTFDGILFFSPSGVHSYTQLNSIKEATAFCIGRTTAATVKKYTDKINIANKPTIENVIVQAIKTLNYA